MKLGLAGTEKRLNVEHRTSNIERPILMTLRFIYFKKRLSKAKPHFDILRFDIRYSAVRCSNYV